MMVNVNDRLDAAELSATLERFADRLELEAQQYRQSADRELKSRYTCGYWRGHATQKERVSRRLRGMAGQIRGFSCVRLVMDTPETPGTMVIR